MIERTLFINDLKQLEVFSKEISKTLEPGSFLLLYGKLGVGKTTFAQFISSEFGIKEIVNSPTFSILKRYWLEERKCFLNHFDFFKLGKDQDFSLFDDLKYDSINVIEWPELNSSFWSEEEKVISVKIFLIHENKRKIVYCHP